MPAVSSQVTGEPTTTISRKFGSGWEVGGYMTLTDVPFTTLWRGIFRQGYLCKLANRLDYFIASAQRGG